MKFVRRRQPGFGSCDMNDNRAHRRIGGERLEPVAQMTQAERTAAGQLLKRRAAGVLMNGAAEIDHNHRVARKPCRTHDDEPERRDHRAARDDQRHADFPIARGACERADRPENRGQNRDPELAAYPQGFQERFFHECYTVAFWHRAI